MSLIEGVGDEVTILFSLLFLLLLMCLAWVSTSVRERPLNVVVLDRHSFYLLLQRLRIPIPPGFRRREPEPETTETLQSESTTSPDDSTGSGLQDTTEPVSASTHSVETGEQPESQATVTPETVGLTGVNTANLGNQRIPDPTPSNETEPAVDESNAVSSEIPEETLATENTTDSAEVVSDSELRQRRLAFFGKQSSVQQDSPEPLSETEIQEPCQNTVVSPESTFANDLPQTTESSLETSTPLPQQTVQEETIPASSEPSSGESPSADVLGEELQEGHIRIRLKYLDDRQRLVHARPEDTVGTFKRQHFAGELAENMMVRFVCNGQELRQDAMSLQSYNIQDNSVIHCLMSRVEQANQQRQQTRSTEFDMGTLMFPLFGLMLFLGWYCRFAYKQYFNAMSTFSLIGITFLYLVSLLASWRLQEVHEHEE